jgi:hypothetical protein
VHNPENEHSNSLTFCPLQDLGRKLFQEDKETEITTDRTIAFLNTR